MKKRQKRTGPATSVATDDTQDEAVIRNLVGLALDLRELDAYAVVPDDLKKKSSELRKSLRKCLHQKKESALTEALERTREEDQSAYVLLRSRLEEASESTVFRRDRGPELEVDAFVIPLFAHTIGGLRIEQCFQDPEAFELLRDSFQEGELESRQASVVLVSHAYHLAEIDRIGYSQLSAMVGEAFESMTRKKTVAAPAITASMSGWPENRFSADDNAVELRFLLGFALKPVDDPFYKVPEKEAAADRYFEARAERFRRWSQQVVPLLKRSLVTDGRDIAIDFLYQDLLHGGKATGRAEYAMLQMMSELQQALHTHGLAPTGANAVVGPIDIDDETVLRVHLYANSDGALLATADRPGEPARDLQDELTDTCDALMTLGVISLALARKFDADDQPVDVRPYKPS